MNFFPLQNKSPRPWKYLTQTLTTMNVMCLDFIVPKPKLTLRLRREFGLTAMMKMLTML